MSTQLTDSPVSSPAPAFGAPFPMARVIHESLKDLHDNWGWFVALGVALIALGAMAMTYSVAFTITTAVVFGFFLLGAGVFYLAGAFFTRGWGGFFLSLLAGVLHLAVGVIVLNHPFEAVVLYTLLMAVFFFVEGLFRSIAAIAGRFQNWGWVLCNGVITLLLGVLIWRQWPFSGLYVVGLFLGINLIVSGASYVSLGLSARKLPV
jgi:uncharacterized membrane protein HdeD (DUF308 family)